MKQPDIRYREDRRRFYARFKVNGKVRYFDLGANLDAAKVEMDRLLVQTARRIIMPKRHDPGQVLTIADAFDAYVQHQKSNPRSSPRNLENIIFHHKAFKEFSGGVGTKAGDLPVSAATPELLIGYLQTKEALKPGWHGGTLRHAAGAAKAAMRYCVRARLIPYNPWDLVPLPTGNPVEESRALTRGELAEILANAKGTDRIILAVLYDCAARPSELSAATWENLIDDRVVLSKHKTVEKSRRPRVLQFSSRGMAALSKLDGPRKGYIFPNVDGGMLSRIAWHRIVKRATKGLPELQWVTPYTFRHSRATHLAEDGADPKTMAQLLGNSVEMVLSRYSHPSPEHVKKAVEL